MGNYQTPGLYPETFITAEPSPLRTSVPAFLGYTEKGQVNQLMWLTHQAQLSELLGEPQDDAYLVKAVRGFFENGGELCCAVRLERASPRGRLTPANCLGAGLAQLEALDSIDLICAPDIMAHPTEALTLQQLILDHCDQSGDRFAILDAIAEVPSTPTNNAIESVLAQRQTLKGMNGALYFPWIDVGQRTEKADERKVVYIPPCGHVAGIYAKSDAHNGVHKAPANERLEGVIDVAMKLNDVAQWPLNEAGINCLRAFPGRGIRIWGARTLSDDPAWRYVNVRRLLLTAGRWIEHTLAGVVFEPNNDRLWAQIRRELTVYFTDLWQRGALLGSSAADAFYVKCDAETNPPALRETGMLITEIGLAPTSPSEFVVVRIIQNASGVTLAGPALA